MRATMTVTLMTRVLAAVTTAVSLAAPALGQAIPPPIINYQGVLLDNVTGSPVNVQQSMLFRYYASSGGTNEIMLEFHTDDDVGAVPVNNGLFNVQLGTGNQLDGSEVFPNDPYLSLATVFRDFGEVWLEVSIKVGEGPGGPIFETLTPRTRIVSAAYALNAGALNGKNAGSFLDTSAMPQTKAGPLTLPEVSLGIGMITSGSGDFSFVNGLNTMVTAALGPNGDFGIDGDLFLSGNDIIFGASGATFYATSLTMVAQAGDAETDDLYLSAGNSLDDGSIILTGDGDIELRSGNGTFSFVRGTGLVETASLDSVGNLQLDGKLTVFSTVEASSLDLQLTTLGSTLTILDRDNNSFGESADWCTNGGCSGSNQLMELQDTGDLRIGGVLSQNQFDLAEVYLEGEPVEPGDIVRLHPGRRGAVLLSAGADDQTVLGVVSERPGVVLGGAPFGADRLEQMWGPEVRARFEGNRRRLEAAAAASDPDLGGRLVELEAIVGSGDAGNRRTAAMDGESSEGRELAELRGRLEKMALEAFYREQFASIALAGRVPVKVDASFGAITAGDPLSPSPVPGVAMKANGRGPVIGIALESFDGGRGKVEMFVTREQPQALEPIRAAQRDLENEVELRTPDPDTGVQSLAGHMQVVLDRDADDEARFSVFRDGRDDDPGAEVFRVDERGNVFSKGSFRPNAMDVAEVFRLSEPAEPGDLLALDPERPGLLRPVSEAADAGVIGVVPSDPGILLGSGIDRMLASDADLALRIREAREEGDDAAEARWWRELETSFARTHVAVAMSGTVLAKVDAGYGAVRAGDLLAASPTPGHAMRADDPRPGTIVGKALEPLESGTGVIRILVMLR